jgi:hypothetical protein
MAPYWDSWRFLLGEWIGEGGGKPGQGYGNFSFDFDLQEQILVRRNHMGYPATNDQPAIVHDDLLIIYPGTGATTQAIYFDNEGHVIHYKAELSQDQKALMFLSDPTESMPQFRLTYLKTGEDILTVRFEIAPPGRPGAFIVYAEGIGRRKSREA